MSGANMDTSDEALERLDHIEARFDTLRELIVKLHYALSTHIELLSKRIDATEEFLANEVRAEADYLMKRLDTVDDQTFQTMLNVDSLCRQLNIIPFSATPTPAAEPEQQEPA
jgi:hypothetical protein